MGLQDMLAGLGGNVKDQYDLEAEGHPRLGAPIQSLDRGSEDVIADIIAAISKRPDVEFSKKERIVGTIANALSTYANMKRTGRPGEDFLGQLRNVRQRDIDRGQQEKLAGLQMELGSAKDREREATRKGERDEGLALDAKLLVQGNRRQDAQTAETREYNEEQAGIEFRRGKELIRLRQSYQKDYDDDRVNQLDDDMRNAVSAAAAEVEAMIYGDPATQRQPLPEGADVAAAIQRYRIAIRKFGLSEELTEQAVEEFSVALEAAGFRRKIVEPDDGGRSRGGAGGVGGSVNTFFERLAGTNPQADTPLPVDEDKALEFRRIADILSAAVK